MNISKKLEGDKLTVALEGRLDSNTSRMLEEELFDSLDGITTLIFDFENLEYLSSAGIRVVLSAYSMLEENGGTATIINPNEEIVEIFEITGLTEILALD